LLRTPSAPAAHAIRASSPARRVQHLACLGHVRGLHRDIFDSLIRREHARSDSALTGQADGQQRLAIDGQRRGFANRRVVEWWPAMVEHQVVFATRRHGQHSEVTSGERFGGLGRHAIHHVQVARTQREHAGVGIGHQSHGELGERWRPIPVLGKSVGVELLTDRQVARLVWASQGGAVLVDDEELGGNDVGEVADRIGCLEVERGRIDDLDLGVLAEQAGAG
jgi:hypothetical protein